MAERVVQGGRTRSLYQEQGPKAEDAVVLTVESYRVDMQRF